MDFQSAKTKLQSSSLMSKLQHLAAIKYLEESDDVGSVDVLVNCLVDNPHTKKVRDILVNMDDQDKNDRLWEIFDRERQREVGLLLKEARIPCSNKALTILRNLKLGQIEELSSEITTLRRVLSYLEAGDTDIDRSVWRYVRKLPYKQEINNTIFTAWIKTESSEIESIIRDQHRLPGSGEKEALFYLVTGNVKGYHDLKDEDGRLFAEVWIMASQTFQARINQTVINSKDDTLTENYQKALGHEKHFDSDLYRKALEESGNEEALFEAVGTMNLIDVLGLCERWQENYFRPSKDSKVKVLEKVLTAFQKVGKIECEEGERLPGGTKDLISYWESQKESEADIRSKMRSPDPFQVAEALYRGKRIGLVESSDIDPQETKEHWPLLLVSRLLFPEKSEMSKWHFIEWLSNLSELNLNFLRTPIACTPLEFSENRMRLEQLTREGGESLTCCLLKILVTFQKAFADWLIVDESEDAPDKGAIEVEENRDYEMFKS